jgi:arsenate reductase
LDKKKVLFLCTGNTCRSQMSEAVVNARLGEHWHAVSAGVQPASQGNPRTNKALAEIGIEHHGVPKHADTFMGEKFDLVVTVCDDAAEACPVWLGQGAKTHLGFPDPANATGTEEEIMAVYRQVLTNIADKIPKLLEQYEKELV